MLTSGLSSGDGTLLHTGDARLVPKSEVVGGNVAAASRRRTRNVEERAATFFVNVKGARSDHGTFL
jgi:hypothetical protein